MDRDTYLKELKNIFDSFLSGISVVDESGIVVINNNVACRLLNSERNDIENKAISDVLPEIQDDIDQVLRTQNLQTDRRATICGRELIFNRCPVFIDQRVALIINVFQESSNHKQVHDDFKTISKLIEIIENKQTGSVDGYWVNDRHGRVVAVSRSSAKRINVRQQDAVGMQVEDFVHSGIVDKIVTNEVIKTKTAVTCLQRLKNGKRLLSTGTPLFDLQGEVDLVIVNECELSDSSILSESIKEGRILLHHLNSRPSSFPDEPSFYTNIILQSKEIKAVFNQAMKVAAVDSSVLIQGESGIGKTFFAKIIHDESERKSAPFNRVDCGAIPEALIESELFGYEQGAFTGARAEGKPGQFELTEGGTLFLDEVAELPLAVQVKILRFLDDKEVVRVGGTKHRKIDLRVIAATNKNLESMVSEGTFRHDLFFRLNVVPLSIPPLRKRVEDIPPLINFYLDNLNQKYSSHLSILPRVIDCLKKYSFPGNVRELANLVERLVVLSSREFIDLDDLPDKFTCEDVESVDCFTDDNWNLPQKVVEYERKFIIRALRVFGSQRKTAVKIGIEQSTLSRKIKRYGIKVDEIIHHDD